MTCHEAQVGLSLYLYGELDFAEEEQLEQHLAECPLCDRALAREKTWHTALNSEQRDVPLDLLASCRNELTHSLRFARKGSGWQSLFRRLEGSWFSPSRWSMGLAAASFLLFLGFTAGRYLQATGSPNLVAGPFTEMGLFPSNSQIRDIRTGSDNRVRIIVDQVQEREISGSADDAVVRKLLLAATKNSADPGIRVDSVEVLNGQLGGDVRDALLYSVSHDANPAVRLKAVDGLRNFAGDPVTRDTLKYVLQTDADPGVRTEAINVLIPTNQSVQVTPELATALQQVLRSEQENDYVRMRCLQVLQQMNPSLDIY